jgi:hypothetical protein
VEENKKMLSRDCDGCSNRKECCIRFERAKKGDKVYCPDGTAHLIDNSSILTSQGIICLLETIQ